VHFSPCTTRSLTYLEIRGDRPLYRKPDIATIKVEIGRVRVRFSRVSMVRVSRIKVTVTRIMVSVRVRVSAPSLDTFKKHLKAHLFAVAYDA